MKNYQNFILRLKQELTFPLPGLNAQLELAPDGRREEYPDLNLITGYRKSAVAVVLYPKHDGIYFPLIERVKYSGVHSGQIALPGGKVDPSDLDFFGTALRETKEEIGVQIAKENILGTLTDLYIPPSNFLVRPVVAFSDIIPDFKIQPREVEQLIECPLEHFMKMEIQFTQVKNSSTGEKIKTPFFDINGKILWGATAMILNEMRWIINNC